MRSLASAVRMVSPHRRHATAVATAYPRQRSRKADDCNSSTVAAAAAALAAATGATAGAVCLGDSAHSEAADAWARHVDSAGKPYYYNAGERRFSWSAPEGSSPSASPSTSSSAIAAPAGVTTQRQSTLRRNIVLGDTSLPEEKRPHRVALCEWPADQCKHNGDARTASPHALFSWVKANGYDGVEMSVGFFKQYFRNMSPDDVAKQARAAAAEQGMKIFGTNVWWVWDYPSQDWEAFLSEMAEEVRLTKLMGGEYVTFQVWLSPEHLDTGGEYRRDQAYLERVAKRIEDLHRICWDQDMNCYIETHVQRVSEDPEAFCKIMDFAGVEFEVNGDLSHYVFRGMRSSGSDVARILSRMGHTHQRMARQFGDLSVDVADPAADWSGRGVTWSAYEFSRPGFVRGLSSRVVCGESGPMHGVHDPLRVDASLVPLYRMMAACADASARGEECRPAAQQHNPFQ